MLKLANKPGITITKIITLRQCGAEKINKPFR